MANALNKVLRPGVNVVLTVNGETGRSVSQYAASWLALVQESKKRILANHPRVDPREVGVGVSLNYNRMAGWVDFDSSVKPSRELFWSLERARASDARARSLIPSPPNPQKSQSRTTSSTSTSPSSALRPARSSRRSGTTA